MGAAFGTLLIAANAAPALAASNPSGTSAGGVAGQHYAGQQPQNSTNPTSTSQYDVACYQVSRH